MATTNKLDYARIGKQKVLEDMPENVRNKASGVKNNAGAQLRNTLVNLVDEATHAIQLIDDLSKPKK